MADILSLAYPFLNESIVFLKPLMIFILGIAVYGLFIFKFYKFVAKRDIFEFNLKQYNTSDHPVVNKFFAFIYYVIESLIFIPFLIFFWFVVFSILMVFLSKNNDVTTILLISGALVGAIRVTAYYSEDLSKDLAKLIPFALLGIFIVDVSYFNFDSSIDALYNLASFWKVAFYYLLFIILLEFILRIFYAITSAMGLSIGEDDESLKKEVKRAKLND